MKGKHYFTVGGLFSGVGGIELGLKNTELFKTLWTNEIDSKACETFRLNFPEIPLLEDDIRNLNGNELDPVDVLVAGFPCQAFSIAGYRKGFEDKRGNLFFEIMRLVKEMDDKPKAIILENVKNLVNHDGGNTFKVIRDFLENFGYSFFCGVLNTADYTRIPQNRERTYIICFKDEVDWNLKSDKDLSRVCSYRFDKEFPPKKSDTRYHIKDLLEKEKVDERYYYQKDWHKYDELKQHMKRRDTVYQWRRVYVRENQSDLCPTLTANMGTGGHNVPLVIDDFGFRKLTPRECFRFQGFPDSFCIPDDMSISHLYKQAGNSVSVPMFEILGNLIFSALLQKYSPRMAEDSINVSSEIYSVSEKEIV